jgi:hypothetical protein
LSGMFEFSAGGLPPPKKKEKASNERVKAPKK